MWGVEIDRMKCGIEIGLVFVPGSKLILFLCAGRKLVVFSVNMEIKLVFVMVVEIDWISAWRI